MNLNTRTMKRLIMITYFLAAGAVAFAQKNHRVYQFDRKEDPKEVQRYGEYPEFPFLRNLSSPQQFVAAMHAHNNTELNNILKGLGFAHGAKDVTAAAVSSDDITEGTIGNMGDAAHHYAYVKLENNGNGIKAWKVSSGDGASVYFISKCGNAFYPDPQVVAPAAAQALPTTPEPSPEVARMPVCKDKVYIYYGGIRGRSHGWDVYADDMEEQKCSNPADHAAMNRAEQEPAMAYDASNINVERTAEYLGYRQLETKSCMSRREFKEFKRTHRGCGCRR